MKTKVKEKTEKISHNDSQNELQVEPVFSEYQIKSISCTKKKKRKATLNLTKNRRKLKDEIILCLTVMKYKFVLNNRYQLS